MSRDDILFHKFDVHSLKRHLGDKIVEAANSLPDSKLMQGTVDDLVNELVRGHASQVPLLAKDKINAQQSEIDMEVPSWPGFMGRGEETVSVRGTEVRFYVPFTGEAELFGCRPSTYDMSPPRAEVKRGELVVHVRGREGDAASYRKAFDDTVASIETYLGRLRDDLKGLEEFLQQSARPAIERRRQKRTKDEAIVDGLGFPKRAHD